MLDVIGTVLLTALAVILVVTFVPRLREGHGVTRARLAVGLIAWFVVAALLGVGGAFASPVLPVGVAVGIAVFGPVLLGAGPIAITRGHGIPLSVLVGVHVGRVLGAAFLMLYSAGRLPFTLAHSVTLCLSFFGVVTPPAQWVEVSIALSVFAERLLLKTTVFGAVLNAGLNLFLIPRYGRNGAAFATVVGEFVTMVLLLWGVHHAVHAKPPGSRKE